MQQLLVVRQFFYSASIDVDGFGIAEGLIHQMEVRL
jgi:hypothetical protein